MAVNGSENNDKETQAVQVKPTTWMQRSSYSYIYPIEVDR